ncbi:MAG: PEP-CTERM sorting domain-containing protein, partial [Planctomycetota bacterium]
GDPRDIGQVVRVGFAALSDTSEANSSSVYYTYLDSFGGPAADEAQFTPAVILREFGEPVDTPRLNSLDDTGIDAFLSEPNGTTDIYFEADTDYTFSVEIEYLSETSASFTSSITDGVTTATQPAVIDDDLRVGDWFGLLGRKSSIFEGEIIFDSFSITQATETGLIGDYDDDGQVAQGDLNLVLNNWGEDAPFDPNGEAFTTGTVDQEELNRVLNNWGSTSAPSFERSAVPEPASFALLSGLALAFRRRRN